MFGRPLIWYDFTADDGKPVGLDMGSPKDATIRLDAVVGELGDSSPTGKAEAENKYGPYFIDALLHVVNPKPSIVVLDPRVGERAATNSTKETGLVQLQRGFQLIVPKAE